MTKKQWIFGAKVLVSAGIMTGLLYKVLAREGADELWGQLAGVVWPWLGVSALMQLSAIGTSVVRWQRLLVGQGIHAPWRHLIGSFMVGRFFGAVSPGGWSGLGGYRLYDIAVHTGKVSRSTAVIGIEMVLGQLAFGAVVIAGSVFGLRVLGLEGVLLVDGFFVGLIGVGIVLLSRPALFRTLASRLSAAYRSRLQSVVDAVCAYQGRADLVVQAALLGMGTHAFNNLIYVAAARALGTELGVGEVFFVSAMQIFATLLPASINGIGLREATAVALYTSVGVPASVALLIPVLGFSVEMLISSVGGLVFLGRRVGYAVEIRVDDPEREDVAHAAIEEVPRERWPRWQRGLAVGLASGLMAGVLLGLGEAAAILWASAQPDWSVLGYSVLLYGICCGLGGAAAGGALAWSGRLLRRAAEQESMAYARLAAAMFAAGSFVLGAFRVRRDLFHEELVWKSPRGVGVLLACLVGAAVLYLLVSFALRQVLRIGGARMLLHWWGSPAAVGVLIVLLFMVGAGAGSHVETDGVATGARAPAKAGNILFLVVDTLRADHLPSYGYGQGKTPHLDAFARDAIRFDQAFANASWTRPSFASILTGRYAASHRTMAKPDALPDALVTLPEALQEAGYSTMGLATNFNVAPFFNFHQGFDQYHYLEPDYVLGANDTSSKLLLVQFARRIVEKIQPARPGSVYKDATHVNAVIVEYLDSKPAAPWMVFAGYMDPHDPYYEHPYRGGGYARSTHQRPKPAEAPKLRKLYDGEITFWDEHFGQLLEALKARGLYDELTLVITSDHGEEFMDHGGYWHGTTLYDEQIRVPLFVKLPQSKRGGTVAYHWVQSIDLMPSLLTLSGVQVPEGVQGHDLFKGSDEAYAEESHEGNVLRALRVRRDGHELKLIAANPGNPRGLQTRELYRVDNDPGEQRDLAREQPMALSQAEQRLEAYAEQAAKGAVRARAVDMGTDQAAIDRLKALGYATDEPAAAAPR